MATPKLIVNELLTYVFHHIQSYPADSIKDVVTQFYRAEAINTAKSLLWDTYSTDLPNTRKRTEKGQRSVVEKEAEDIIKGVKVLDEKSNEMEYTTVFVAMDLRKIPDVKPGELETFSLLERVNKLERQMASVCKPHVETYADVVTSSHTNRRTSNTAVSGLAGLTVHLPPERGDAMTRPPADAQRDNDDGFVLPADQRKRNNRLLKRAANDAKPKPKPKPKAVFGTRQSDILRSGPRRFDLFVFRVDNSIEDDNLKSFLTSENIVVHDLERVSRDDAWTKSFRVTVVGADLSVILNPDFWPNGIGCRRFRRKNTTD